MVAAPDSMVVVALFVDAVVVASVEGSFVVWVFAEDLFVMVIVENAAAAVATAVVAAAIVVELVAVFVVMVGAFVVGAAVVDAAY